MVPPPVLTYDNEGLGLPSNVVRLLPYNSEWPRIFAREQARIESYLNLPDLTQVEHIGSTAVPELGAKPVIDIMIGLPAMDIASTVSNGLQLLGYISKGEKGIPGRLFFVCGEPAIFHVHLVQLNSSFWNENLLFRDQLRSQKRIAEDYLQMKLNLARLFPNDRDSYTSGKASFIEDVLASAAQH